MKPGTVKGDAPRSGARARQDETAAASSTQGPAREQVDPRSRISLDSDSDSDWEPCQDWPGGVLQLTNKSGSTELLSPSHNLTGATYTGGITGVQTEEEPAEPERFLSQPCTMLP